MPVTGLGAEFHSEYRAWVNAKYRCTKVGSQNYERYGGRGIRVCAEWLNDFARFFSDMGPKPSAKHSLERRNNDGHYEPSNCYWATWREQKLNSTSGPKRMDLTGHRFRRLTVLHAFPRRPNRCTDWWCRCDCGQELKVSIAHLRSGHTLSCGCLHRDILRARKTQRNAHVTSVDLPD